MLCAIMHGLTSLDCARRAGRGAPASSAVVAQGLAGADRADKELASELGLRCLVQVGWPWAG